MTKDLLNNLERLSIGRCSIHKIQRLHALKIVENSIKYKNKIYILTPNVDHIVKLQNDPFFLKVYSKAKLVLPDGKPLIWISKIYKNPLPEKISGSDFFYDLCKLANVKRYKLFFLGGKAGAAEKTRQLIIKAYSNIPYIGFYCPKYGFEKDKKYNLEIISRINIVKPDILFVALGAPKQEKWIYNHYKQYEATISIGVGATLDFSSGIKNRAPICMQNIGLEWFYRLLQEPKRLFKRYIIDDSFIIPIILKDLLKINK